MLNDVIMNKLGKVVIWGCGILGATNLVYLTKVGYKCLGIDTNEGRLRELESKRYSINSDIEVLNYYQQPEYHVELSNDFHDALDESCHIHFICIPTERNGIPCNDVLYDVVDKILSVKRNNPILIVIESTIEPNWLDTVYQKIELLNLTIGKDVLIATGPRRDLFGDVNFSLRNTNRVIGGDSDYTIDLIKLLYGEYCDNLVIAKNNKYAMLSKIVENSYRFIDLTFTNMLSESFADIDMVHALELAGTKWNMNTYHSSLGIGGYCVPLAPLYLSDEIEALNNNKLSILNQFLEFNNNHTINQYNTIKTLLGDSKKIAVLGISYIANVKVLSGSVSHTIINNLVKDNFIVGIHDPFVSEEEVSKLFDNCQYINYPNSLNDYDAVIVMVAHDCYKNDIRNNLKPSCKIIDNLGVLSDYQYPNYYEIGRKKIC